MIFFFLKQWTYYFTNTVFKIKEGIIKLFINNKIINHYCFYFIFAHYLFYLLIYFSLLL